MCKALLLFFISFFLLLLLLRFLPPLFLAHVSHDSSKYAIYAEEPYLLWSSYCILSRNPNVCGDKTRWSYFRRNPTIYGHTIHFWQEKNSHLWLYYAIYLHENHKLYTFCLIHCNLHTVFCQKKLSLFCSEYTISLEKAYLLSLAGSCWTWYVFPGELLDSCVFAKLIIHSWE